VPDVPLAGVLAVPLDVDGDADVLGDEDADVVCADVVPAVPEPPVEASASSEPGGGNGRDDKPPGAAASCGNHRVSPFSTAAA
jgi:hypothetical protein